MRTKLFTFPITLRTLNHISGLLLRLQATFGYQVENFPFVYFIFCVLFLFFVLFFFFFYLVLFLTSFRNIALTTVAAVVVFVLKAKDLHLFIAALI